MQWPSTCSIPSHAPWAPPGPGEAELCSLMCCNFTNKMSDDLLRTLPHGPAFPTLRYWTGTIMCCLRLSMFLWYSRSQYSHYQSDRTHHAIDFVNWWTLMTVQLDTTSESHFWRTSLPFVFVFQREKALKTEKWRGKWSLSASGMNGMGGWTSIFSSF